LYRLEDLVMPAKTPFLAVLALAATLPLSTAAGAFELEKRLPLSPSGTAALRTEVSGISVLGIEAGEAVVRIRSNRDDFAEKFDVRFEAKGADRVELVVERKTKGPLGWFGDGFNSRTEIEVTLPRGASAEVESSGGGIEVRDLGGNVRAESSGGGVDVEKLGGDATLSSSGGAIHAERVAGDIDASSSGGGVRIDEAGGAVTAGSSGGSVSVAFAAGNARGGSLDSSGGGVSAQVDPGVGLEIDAAASGGSVDCDLPVTVRGRMSRDSIHGQLNGGGSVLKLRSSGGGVAIGAIDKP
jgi:hypothetical protein